MDVHKNARLTPHCRGLLVERVLQGQPKAKIAAQFAISVQTIDKWLARYRAEGSAGLVDRSSRPRCSRGPPFGNCSSQCWRYLSSLSPHLASTQEQAPAEP